MRRISRALRPIVAHRAVLARAARPSREKFFRAQRMRDDARASSRFTRMSARDEDAALRGTSKKTGESCNTNDIHRKSQSLRVQITKSFL
jgi:hypothetical protein